MTGDGPFTCPKCGHKSAEFYSVCPECGRRFVRDHIDTRMHPRDPDLPGVCTNRFWIRIFLLLNCRECRHGAAHLTESAAVMGIIFPVH